MTLFLDTRKMKANSKYPLKMTIYSRPYKKRYSSGIDLTEDDWKKVNGQRLKDENLKKVRISVNALTSKAERIFEEVIPFSFVAFENAFFTNGTTKTDLSLENWFMQYVSELDSQDRIATSISYRTTFNSLNAFKSNLMLTDITTEFLEDYELFMKQKEKSPSTIGIYLRQLRAILNRAKAQQVLKPDCYPFKAYKIPASRNCITSLYSPKAFNSNQITSIILAQTPGSINFRPLP